MRGGVILDLLICMLFILLRMYIAEISNASLSSVRARRSACVYEEDHNIYMCVYICICICIHIYIHIYMRRLTHYQKYSHIHIRSHACMHNV